MDVIATRKEKVIYRDGDSAIKEFSEKFPKSDILNEALNQSRVEETGLPIPALKSVSVINGNWTIAMEYVEGKTLEQIMEEDKLNDRINETEPVDSEPVEEPAPEAAGEAESAP